MAQQDLQIEDIPSFEEEALGGLDENYLFINNPIGRSELLIFLHKLRLGSQNQLVKIQEMQQQLKSYNDKLRKRLSVKLDEQLEKTLKKNNELINHLCQIQNMFINNEKYLNWVQLKLEDEKELQDEIELQNQNTNKLEEEAEKARTYPRLTPFHYTPFPHSPFGY